MTVYNESWVHTVGEYIKRVIRPLEMRRAGVPRPLEVARAKLPPKAKPVVPMGPPPGHRAPVTAGGAVPATPAAAGAAPAAAGATGAVPADAFLQAQLALLTQQMAGFQELIAVRMR